MRVGKAGLARHGHDEVVHGDEASNVVFWGCLGSSNGCGQSRAEGAGELYPQRPASAGFGYPLTRVEHRVVEAEWTHPEAFEVDAWPLW